MAAARRAVLTAMPMGGAGQGVYTLTGSGA